MSKNRCGQCGELKRGHMCKMPRAMGGTSFAAQEARNGDARERVCAPSDRPASDARVRVCYANDAPMCLSVTSM